MSLNQAAKQTTEDPELADRFNRVLGATVEAMEDSGIRYTFIGGIASGGLGRPRSTHDIDLFVQPEAAEVALRALARKGFATEKTDPSWLYKGFKEGILVDVIFKSKGEIYLDNEMYERTITAPFHGRQLRLVAPEDLLIIKAAAHSELTPNHWHDAMALLSHASLDWPYLIRRARRAPRRILSLLLYAQSNDIWVPNHVINELYNGIFGTAAAQPQGQLQGAAPAQAQHQQQQQPRSPGTRAHLAAVTSQPARVQHGPGAPPEPSAGRPEARKHEEYVVAHIRERLAEDRRTHELDIDIEQKGQRILIRGEVPTEERRQAVERIVRESFPEFAVENQIRILSLHEPTEAEEMP